MRRAVLDWHLWYRRGRERGRGQGRSVVMLSRITPFDILIPRRRRWHRWGRTSAGILPPLPFIRCARRTPGGGRRDVLFPALLPSPSLFARVRTLRRRLGCDRCQTRRGYRWTEAPDEVVHVHCACCSWYGRVVEAGFGHLQGRMLACGRHLDLRQLFSNDGGDVLRI